MDELSFLAGSGDKIHCKSLPLSVLPERVSIGFIAEQNPLLQLATLCLQTQRSVR